MANVSVKGVGKIFGTTRVLKDVNLEIADREFLVLVGPSGCGKSTLLRMLAGLEETTEGELLIGGEIVNHLPPRDREIAMVFQDYALYPHMTVAENMSFGLRIRRMPHSEIDRRVREAAEILQITNLLDRTPKQLSGGQRQRVAIGRAIVRKPKVFLFDEPLSNLDAKLREEMRIELAKLHMRLKATMVYVTHDQVEAMTLADRIAVMKGGRIQQLGAPAKVFAEPDNVFVAGFIGSPTMNFVKGALVDKAGLLRFEGNGVSVPAPRPEGAAPAAVTLGIRPECLELGANGGESFEAEIEVVELLGHWKNVHLKAGGQRLLAVTGAPFAGKEGGRVMVRFDPGGIHLFSGEAGERLRIMG